jgi:hypothetical protein
MSKLDLKDTVMDAIIKMSEGNPGAITALMEIIQKGNSIDPQSFAGDLSAILGLDTMKIYGTEIYILWSDKCGRDTRKLLMLLRAVQLGFLSQQKLKEMSEDQMREVNLSEEEFSKLDKKVCNRLTGFQKAT